MLAEDLAKESAPAHAQVDVGGDGAHAGAVRPGGSMHAGIRFLERQWSQSKLHRTSDSAAQNSAIFFPLVRKTLSIFQFEACRINVNFST